MSDLQVYQKPSKLEKIVVSVLAATAFMVSNVASAATQLDIGAIVDKIGSINDSTNAVGSAFVTVAVGMVIFGFIIHMIMRKGQ